MLDWIRQFFNRLFSENAKEWSYMDQLRANLRGWGVYETVEDDEILVQLQAVDDRMDRGAWYQVALAAGRGDALSTKALVLLADKNPDEFRSISNYAASVRKADQDRLFS